ncbi:DUF1850 domain-containing protein [Alkalicoccobacillus porphyridii]|uniref:DUF1850 domain-containing protein n=1 Tax=Alkalicoccobacillus porphyridii TaxID=2597270 RepID=A0A554A1B9_9BACI|nr:DUF1850 domain-containing protein [Alkalicoccobacillus porphyridii]TSB47475.1 DUF1850 domain-containing protein [Alkalicoccobacillus porphyridii]
MSSKKKKIWIGSAFLIALPLLLFYRLPVIEISGEESSYFIREDEFELGWIHSIEKEEWVEHYERQQDILVLTETHFKTFGAGTPYQGEETTTEDGFIRMALNIEHEELNVTISEHVQTTLFILDREVPLYHCFEQYESVTIKARNLALWEYKRGEFL